MSDFSEYSDEYNPYNEIQKAVTNNDYETLQQLLDDKEEDVNSLEPFGFTSLHTSVMNGDEISTELLLRYGANPNIIAESASIYEDIPDEVVDVLDEMDYIGKTPFHIAIEQNNVELVELLLEYKSDPEIPTSDGEYPIHVASQSANNEEIVYLLIEYGTNINRQDEFGRSALHYAIMNDNYTMMTLLLQAGINVNLRDENGRTALQIYLML